MSHKNGQCWDAGDPSTFQLLHENEFVHSLTIVGAEQQSNFNNALSLTSI